MCTNAHHINFEKVKNEPTFDIVWKDIEKYFLKSIVIGHNVKSADLDALVKYYYVDINDYIEKYEVRDAKEFETFINSSQMRREINGLYGVIQGIELFLHNNFKVSWKV